MAHTSGDSRPFWIATTEEILGGEVTDIYFERVKTVLSQRGVNPYVRAEVRASALPKDWQWAVLSGCEELARLFERTDVRVESVPEGTIFHRGDPVVAVEGRYLDFAVLETALLGVLCQASGVATKAARFRKLAEGRPIYSFGARRMHPALAPMIDRSAFIGGCDAVAVTKSADLLNEQAVGTMSHSLMLCMGDEAAAYKAFDEFIGAEVPRVALVDTFSDEKFGALIAAETLGDRLSAVRLDTPGSRRGDFRQIIEEVRWELDLRGFSHVKIIVSGGIREEDMPILNPVVDGYGIGTSISNAPVVDLAMDIVEVDGKPFTKRGKPSGAKLFWQCGIDGATKVTPRGRPAPSHCGRPMQSISGTLVDHGRVSELPRPRAIRDRVIDQLSRITMEDTNT